MPTGRWRQERQFGVSVGLVLVAIAAWFVWRGRGPLPVAVLGGAGTLLVGFGLACPVALVYPNRWWVGLADAVAWISVRVMLGLLFYLVFTPLTIATIGSMRAVSARLPLAS